MTASTARVYSRNMTFEKNVNLFMICVFEILRLGYLQAMYSLEISMHELNNNQEQLKEMYQKVRSFNPAYDDPKYMGNICELRGKTLLHDGDYTKANLALMDSFNHYQSVGNPRRKKVLQYTTFSSILSNSMVNPFDNMEARVLQGDPMIRIPQKNMGQRGMVVVRN